MPHDVFMCHSSQDADAAEAICGALESAQIACWIAPRDPVPGIPYAGQLVAAIEDARLVLVVLSAHANASQHVLREVELAATRRKTIVPVRVDDTLPTSDMEYYVRSLHWLDASRPPPEDRLGEIVAHFRPIVARARGGEEPVVDRAPSREASRTTDAPLHNLPAQLTSFVGRSAEVSQIERLLGERRLVTLLGAGGVGKTRTAIEVAQRRCDAYRDGAWLVELAPVGEPDLVAIAVANAIGASIGPEKRPLDTVITHLRSRHVLIVLDNCEHLVAVASALAEEVLRRCPDVVILATSREALGIAGESIYRLQTLGLPETAVGLSAAAAREFGAVELFAERAAAISPFTLADDNVAAVVEICRRLDGIPLAIELGAARLKALGIMELRKRLGDRFRVVGGGSRTGQRRQQTLRAMIDWSYDLLTDEERSLFRRLGVFAGGWTIDALGNVCGEDEGDAWELIDTQQSLVDKSLVLADLGHRTERYRFLESMREYAIEKLDQSGEHDNLARRHAAYFAGVVQRAEDDWGAIQLEAWRATYEQELENCRTALEWGYRDLEATDESSFGAIAFAEQGGDLALMRSARGEAVALYKRALEALAARAATEEVERHELALRTKLGPPLMIEAGWGAPEVEANYRRALELAERFADREAEFSARWGLWRYAFEVDEREVSEVHLERLIALATELGEDRFRLAALHARWNSIWNGGALAQAVTDAEEGMRLYDPDRHYAQSFVYGGHDPGDCAAANRAIALALMGRYREAREGAREVAARVTARRYPALMLHELTFASIALYIANDFAGCAAAASTLQKTADEMQLAEQGALARLLVCASRAGLGDREAMSEQLDRALEDVRVVRGAVVGPVRLCVLAENAVDLGRLDLARALVTQALRRHADDSAGLLRSRFEVLDAELTALDDDARAARLQEALAHAERQGATVFALDAATRLAKSAPSADGRASARAAVERMMANVDDDPSVRSLAEGAALLASTAAPAG